MGSKDLILSPMRMRNRLIAPAAIGSGGALGGL